MMQMAIAAVTFPFKGVFLGNIKSGALRYEVVEPESITVKPYKDAAVLHCKIRLGGVAGGSPSALTSS